VLCCYFFVLIQLQFLCFCVLYSDALIRQCVVLFFCVGTATVWYVCVCVCLCVIQCFTESIV